MRLRTANTRARRARSRWYINPGFFFAGTVTGRSSSFRLGPDAVVIDGSGHLVLYDYKTSPLTVVVDSLTEYQRRVWKEIARAYGIPDRLRPLVESPQRVIRSTPGVLHGAKGRLVRD